MTNEPSPPAPDDVDDPGRNAVPVRSRADREMLILATALSVFHACMFLIGTRWSFCAGVLLIGLAGWRDRKVRPDAGDVPLVVYVCLLLFCAAVVASVLAVVGILTWAVLG